VNNKNTYKSPYKNPLRFLFYISLLLGLGACGLPGSETTDQALKEEHTYRQSDPSCTNLDLQSSSLTPSALRGLVACLNSRDQMPEFERLVSEARDEDLAPLTDLVGRLVLTRNDRLFLFDQTFQSMESDGSLNRTLQSVSNLLQEPAVVNSLLRLGSQLYFSGETSVLRFVMNGLQAEPNVELLQAGALIGRQISPQNTNDILSFLIALTEARSYRALLHRISTVARDPQAPALELAVSDLLSLLRKSDEPGRINATEIMINLFASGEGWRLLDALVDDTKPIMHWAPRIHQWAAAINGLYAQDARFLNLAPGFFTALQHTTDLPVGCFRETTNLKPLSAQRVFEELASLGLRPFLNTLAVSSPFCDFPRAIVNGAQALLPLAVTEGALGLEQWAAQFVREPALLQFVVDLLSEQGQSGPRLPLLQKLVEQLDRNGLLKEALLLASTYKVQDRATVNSRLLFLSQVHEDLGSKSIISVVAPVLKHAEVPEIVQLARAALPLVESSTENLGPLLKELQRALLMSEAHPWLDVLKDVLTEAPSNPDIVSALFRIAARQPRQLEAVLREFSMMARTDDGRMRQVLTSFFALFRSAAERGRVTIASGPGVTRRPSPRHDLILADVEPLSFELREGAVASCLNFDLTFSLADIQNSRFLGQFSAFQSCSAIQATEQSYAEALGFLADATAMQGILQGQSLWAYAVSVVQDFASRTLAATAQAVERLVPALRDGRMLSLIQAIPVFVDERVFNPLLQILNQVPWQQSAIVEQSAIVQDDDSTESRRRLLLSMNAQVCTMEAPDPDAEPCDEWNGDVCPVPTPTCESLPLLAAIERQLSVFEPRANVQARTEQILSEYLLAVEHDFYDEELSADRGAQGPRSGLATSWNPNRFMALAGRFHDALINTRGAEQDPEGINQHKPLEGLLHFMSSINGAMNAYLPPERRAQATSAAALDEAARQLTRWMVTEANTFRVIPYYYNGESTPRVRLINNLDGLALILENSRLKLRDGSEPGVIGLMSVPQAWAEEAEDARPSYSNPDNNFTLAKIVEVLLRGLPDVTSCYRAGATAAQYTAQEWACVGRFRNLKGFDYPESHNPNGRKQVPSIVTQLLSYLPPDQDCSRSAYDCYGLRVIRNLFSAVHEKTPAAYRSIFDPRLGLAIAWVNPRVLQEFMSTGVMRAVGRGLFGKSPDDAALFEFFQSAVHLAAHPQYERIVNMAKAALNPADRGQNWAAQSMTNGLLDQRSVSPALAARLTRALFNVRHNDDLAAVAFNGVRLLKLLGLYEAPTDLLEPTSRLLTGLMDASRPGRAVLLDHVDDLVTLMQSRDLSILLDYMTQLQNREHFQDFRSRLARARARGDYPAETIDRFIEDILAFLETPPVSGQNGAALYEETLRLLLARGGRGELEALLRTMGANEAQVRGLLDAAAQFSREGGAERFMNSVGRLLE
jgi:hypothetical protein